MRVGYVQMEPTFGEPRGNLERARRLMASAEAELWVLPELFNTGYVFTSTAEVDQLAEHVPDGPTTKGLMQIAQSLSTHIVAGLAARCGDHVYNAAVVISPHGVESVYNKVHLFAEEKRWFTPGDTNFPVCELNGARVGVMICFDHFFPEAARTLALRGAEIIAHPSNLVMPGVAQRTMTVRALENRVFTVTANRVGTERRNGRALRFTGLSQIISPDGRYLARSPEEGEDVQVVDIEPQLAREKQINPWNDLLADRRSEFYVS